MGAHAECHCADDRPPVRCVGQAGAPGRMPRVRADWAWLVVDAARCSEGARMRGPGQESVLCEASTGQWTVRAASTWPWTLAAHVRPGGLKFRSSSSFKVTVRPPDVG